MGWAEAYGHGANPPHIWAAARRGTLVAKVSSHLKMLKLFNSVKRDLLSFGIHVGLCSVESLQPDLWFDALKQQSYV